MPSETCWREDSPVAAGVYLYFHPELRMIPHDCRTYTSLAACRHYLQKLHNVSTSVEAASHPAEMLANIFNLAGLAERIPDSGEWRVDASACENGTTQDTPITVDDVLASHGETCSR
jgi:hypothetical protein